METASPQKVRGKRGAGPLPRLAATTASVLFLFAVMYAFGILPFVGLPRDYSAQDYDNPLSEGGRAGGGGGSEGWSRAARAAAGPGSDVVVRFHTAVAALRALNVTSTSGGSSNSSPGGASSSGVSFSDSELSGGPMLLPTAACPADLQLGVRPQLHTPALFGNLCEPWAARGAVQLLHMLLSPGMAGLEWGAGASTVWYLARLGRLVSVEHNASWAAEVEALARRSFPAENLARRWDLHVLPPSPAEVRTFVEAESYERFKKYADVAFLEQQGGGTTPRFDFIAIDGQARVACFQRALWLLKSHGGVLVLNSAQRRAYREVRGLVPAHWLRFEGGGPLGSTAVWVSCDAGRCGAA